MPIANDLHGECGVLGAKKTMRRCSASPSVLLKIAAAALWVAALLFVHGEAQGNVTATTDPKEVKALNAIFQKWKISSSMSMPPYAWNTSKDPCSGAALTGQKAYDSMDKTVFNPAIVCDCSYNDSSVCHIMRLKAFDLDIVGTIPKELSQLSYLNNLQIAKNYLFGPLPAFFGNFSNMEWLSIGKNVLSGSIPKELGKLPILKSLGMGMNNFSGSLPPELGNMTSLQQIYIDSIGVSGEIPSTFGNLIDLKFMWASDNNFGGRVPEFLGNFTKMESMRFQGNSFIGPIPSTLANLTGINELRLGDLLNGNSSLRFIRNMKSLATLILRDCKISDTIPDDIGQYVRLTYLDLSFNNITGTLPQSLLSIRTLRRLYLGNNSLSGSLPEQKSQSLIDMDVSYNAFSGSLPSWATDKTLQLNLVANNFLLDDSMGNLYCLQRDFPCYRGSPVYYSFAINCGGDEVVTSDGTQFEPDNQNISGASYYVTSSKRWAVSNVGTFVESPDPKYIEIVNSSMIRNSESSEMKLFQTSRLSPSSLRYYGLGLENGNYTISLRFSETAFPDDRSSSSYGKRIFDIYIQGSLTIKDFDIRKEAGGSFIALERNYTASVTNNYLEIHLFWAGKGTCCIPTQGYYGPSISAISIAPNFRPHVRNRPPSSSKSRRNALIGGLSAASVVLVLLLLAICIWRHKTRRLNKDDDPELIGIAVKPKSFSYLDLKNATGDFNPANKLGEGGFGPVFKGTLPDGKVVAIKQLIGESLQGKRQFVTEIATISAVKHRNLVKLYGCCYEGDHRLIVYEYLENKSLDQALFGKQPLQLNWPTRFDICLGTAKGLAYLHEESRVRIVHRDIKAGNILLDAELTPKISDFGLAKLYDEKMSHISTRVAGTTGYLAPEYAMRGHLTEKADVFSFGVVTLEILSGRSNCDPTIAREKMFLLEWAWRLHEENSDLEMLDARLPSFNKEEATRMIKVAFLCTQSNLTQRPPMSRVIAMLVGDIEIEDVLVKPAYLTDCQFDDTSYQLSSTTDSIPGAGYSASSQSPQTLLVGRGR